MVLGPRHLLPGPWPMGPAPADPVRVPFTVPVPRAALWARAALGGVRAAVPLRLCQSKLQTPTSPWRAAGLLINQHFPDRPLLGFQTAAILLTFMFHFVWLILSQRN